MTNETRLTTQSKWVSCPYCGERFELIVDCSVPSQAYIEDCEVCCQAIEFAIEVDAQYDQISVQAKRLDD